MKKKKQRFISRIPRLIRYPVVAVLAYGLYVLALFTTGNFHTIVKGEAYRSALPTASEMVYYAHDVGVRSVINLRGDHGGEPWYDRLLAIQSQYHVKHYDFKMSGRRPLTKERAEELIALMKEAPKPVLIYCRSGIDRTGLASALYLAGVKGEPVREAQHQLSPMYGHLWFLKEGEMDKSLRRLTPELSLN